jgi:parallel beta-helix repeat protein/predicted outer membrane repeat protein
MYRQSFILWSCALVTIVAVLVPCTASATIRNVPADYPTIQAAVNTCNAGDEIVIAPGTYTGPGNTNVSCFANKSLSIRSQSPSDANVVRATIIDCQGTERTRALDLSGGGTLSIDGLTIIYGSQAIVCRMCPSAGTLTVKNCIISQSSNRAIFASTDNTIISGCTFSGMSDGFSIDTSGPTTIRDCIFTDNMGEGSILASGTTTISRCRVVGGGNGGLISAKGNLTVTDTSISHSSNGGIYATGGNVSVKNCEFVNNYRGYGGGAVFSEGYSTGSAKPYTTTIESCVFTNNHAVLNGGAVNVGGIAMITGSTFSGNMADIGGGGLYIRRGNVSVTQCSFTDNSARVDGGAVSAVAGVEAVGNIRTCLFLRNSAASSGGAICIDSLTMAGCTLSENVAASCGGVRSVPGTRNISSSILWGNNPDSLNGPIEGGVSYSCIAGGATGAGNIFTDPLFDTMRPYHVRGSSPCLNSGDPCYVAVAGETDMEGHPRVLQGRVDMGCYENRPYPVAYAGADQRLYADHVGVVTARLDGTASTDPQGKPIRFLWCATIAGRPFASISPSFTTDLPIGVWSFALVVSNELDASEPNACMVTVVGPVEAGLRIVPQTLNGQASAKSLMAILTIPDISQSDIDPDARVVMLPFGIEAKHKMLSAVNEHGKVRVVMAAFFDAGPVIAAASQTSEVAVQVETKLKSGRYVVGEDTIRVFYPPKGKR